MAAAYRNPPGKPVKEQDSEEGTQQFSDFIVPLQFPNLCSESVLHTPHIKIRTAVPSLCFSLADMSEAKSTEIFDTNGVTGKGESRGAEP